MAKKFWGGEGVSYFLATLYVIKQTHSTPTLIVILLEATHISMGKFKSSTLINTTKSLCESIEDADVSAMLRNDKDTRT